MVNKPKQIGTAAETAAKKHAQQNGFPWAERQVLHGSKDVGDLWLDPIGKAIVEVKAGKAAETASDLQVSDWMAEAEREAGHVGAEAWFLLRKRAGKGDANVGMWWATFRLSTLFRLRGYDFPVGEDGFVTMTYDSALAQIRWAGFGDSPLSPTNGVA